MNRTQIINYLILKNGYKSYLEIGLDNGMNFVNVLCNSKESVDPFFKEDHTELDFVFNDDIPEQLKRLLTYRMTSDEFFAQNKKKYDIIFIDGLHEQSQVARDIVNGIKCLNKGGIIVVHDCLPESELAQIVPRQKEAILWNGDVWKGVYELIQQGIDIQVLDTDFGCGLVRWTDDENILHYPETSKKTWEDFEKDRDNMMNVIDENTFFIEY